MSLKDSATYGKEALWTLAATIIIFSMALTASNLNGVFAVAGSVFAVRSIYLGYHWYVKWKAGK